MQSIDVIATVKELYIAVTVDELQPIDVPVILIRFRLEVGDANQAKED